MPGSYVDERQVVANILDGLSGVPILWPDTEEDPPAPGSDPASPVKYVVVEIEHDVAIPTDMAGGSEIRGRVVTWNWIERNAGDDALRALIDSERTLFVAGDDATQAMYFLPAERVYPSQIGGAGGELYGRRVDWPFTRFRS